MITKTLLVLQEYRDAMKRRKMSEYYTRIDEAILELEEFKDKFNKEIAFSEKQISEILNLKATVGTLENDKLLLQEQIRVLQNENLKLNVKLNEVGKIR